LSCPDGGNLPTERADKDPEPAKLTQHQGRSTFLAIEASTMPNSSGFIHNMHVEDEKNRRFANKNNVYVDKNHISSPLIILFDDSNR